MRRASPDVELFDDALVEPFVVKHQRHFINPFDILCGNHGILGDVTEMGDFIFDFLVEHAIGAAQKNIRLNSQPGQLFDAMLRRFGFQFAAAGDVRHQSQVNIQNILAAQVPSHLAHRFQERQPLDIAHRAADLTDGDIISFGGGEDAPFDLVGDMRDHLNRAAKVIAAPFLGNHRLVNLPRRAVIFPPHGGGHITFVVAEVHIGLGAIVGDEHLAMLIRAHGAWIDIDIRDPFLRSSL